MPVERSPGEEEKGGRLELKGFIRPTMPRLFQSPFGERPDAAHP